MKRCFEVFLTVLLFIFALTFCSCQTQKPGDDESESLTASSVSQGNTLVNEEPEEHTSYSFTSYEELYRTLTGGNTGLSGTLTSESVNYGTVYTATLSSLTTGSIQVVAPQVNGKPVDLRNQEGYANITLMTNELYNLPWIWYHCTVNGYDLSVRVAYPEVLNNVQVNSANTFCEVLAVIAPDAPSPDHYQQYSAYQNIYERELTMAGGEQVTAMVSELKDSDQVYVQFYQDGKLVVLYADADLFTDSFWMSFCVADYQE